MKSPRLMDQVRQGIRLRHYSLRTEQAYTQWLRRYIYIHNKRYPAEITELKITAFLSYTSTGKHVAAFTQNQALPALLFLYKEVLKLDRVVRYMPMF